jgi:hypothetical protein
MVQAQAIPPVSFLSPFGFITHQLAHVLDSLVRVSRRASQRPFVNILRVQIPRDKAPFTPWSVRGYQLDINANGYTHKATHVDLPKEHSTLNKVLKPKGTHSV